MFCEDRGDTACRRRRSACASSVERGARVLVAAHRRQAQRVAALQQAVQDVAERAGVLAQQERDFGIDFVGRRERVGVLRDPLRQHRELVRVLDLAQAAAALPDLLRRLLRELEQRVVALVDASSRPLASDGQALSRCRAARPAATSTRSQRALMSCRSFAAASSCAASSAHALAPCRRLTSASRSALKRSRLSLTAANAAAWPCAASARAAREALRQHLHFGRRRRRPRRSAPTARAVEEHHQRREHEEHRPAATPSIWNCLTTGRWPITGSFARHGRARRWRCAAAP